MNETVPSASSFPAPPTCPDWPRSFDSPFWSFQLPNLLLLAAFLCCNSQCGLLLLRILSVLACGGFAAWSWIFWCRKDWVVWNVAFAAVNLVYLFILCYKMRPIKFARDLEKVYKEMFAPLRVSRQQFKMVTQAVAGTKFVPANHVLVEENKTHVENLTLVLYGSFSVSQGPKKLHVVKSLQFLDSPEWFLVATDHAFQVSMTSLEDSTVIMWHRDRLKLSIMRDQFLQAVFDHILGRDVVRKLLQVSDTMSTATMLRCEKRSYAVNSPDVEGVGVGNHNHKGLGMGSAGDASGAVGNNKPLVVVHREDRPGQESVTNHVLDPKSGERRTPKKKHEEEPLLGKPARANDDFAVAMESLLQAIGRDNLAAAANLRPFMHQHDVIRTTSL